MCGNWRYLSLVPAIPQSEVLAIFLEEIGEKCGEILAKMFCRFLSCNFQAEWPQKNSRRILDIFHSAPNKVFFFFTAATLGAGGPNFPWMFQGEHATSLFLFVVTLCQAGGVPTWRAGWGGFLALSALDVPSLRALLSKKSRILAAKLGEND